MDWDNLKKSVIGFVRRMFRFYEKEIRKFVEDMIDLAYQHLDAETVRNITPAIRKKIANKILADIIIMKIDITTVAGKSEVARLVNDALVWLSKTESE
jgi:ribosomal protein L17